MPSVSERKARKTHRCTRPCRRAIRPGDVYRRIAYFPKTDEVADFYAPSWPSAKPRPIVAKICPGCMAEDDARSEHTDDCWRCSNPAEEHGNVVDLQTLGDKR
jgi:hypothetical protein